MTLLQKLHACVDDLRLLIQEHTALAREQRQEIRIRNPFGQMLFGPYGTEIKVPPTEITSP